MSIDLNTVVWHQFGASIDMLENAVDACPDDLWGDRSKKPEFCYLVYHTLFYLDLYLTGTTEGFSPPVPFDLDEMDPNGLMPERVYTKSELKNYLAYCRQKCRNVLENMSDEQAHSQCVFRWLKIPFAELHLYNMRHVQHHTAQMNLILRQQTDSAPGWVSSAKSGPPA